MVVEKSAKSNATMISHPTPRTPDEDIDVITKIGLPSGDEDVDAIQNIKVGDRVELQKGWVGKIQYIGSVPPIKHEVIGLALDEAIPDGHDGKGLFVCKPQHGYFTQRWRIKRVVHVRYQIYNCFLKILYFI